MLPAGVWEIRELSSSWLLVRLHGYILPLNPGGFKKGFPLLESYHFFTFFQITDVSGFTKVAPVRIWLRRRAIRLRQKQTCGQIRKIYFDIDLGGNTITLSFQVIFSVFFTKGLDTTHMIWISDYQCHFPGTLTFQAMN